MSGKLNTEKRKPKGPIKFNIDLNEEQKHAKTLIHENTITYLKGAPGSGKTLLAANAAIDMFYKREIERIIICRPAVSREDIGFLPGSADDKLMPYLQPVLDNFYQLRAKEEIDQLLKDGVIHILPFAFMRGHTFLNSCIIVDEAQNLTTNMMELVLGRIGMNSKMIICGDHSQIDLRDKKESGIHILNILAKEVEGFGMIELKRNHRDPIVVRMLEVLKIYE